MISVIIPAHNEESVIRRCLDAIVDGKKADELEVLVVCNGCTDNTAKAAKETRFPVRILETPIASKTAALNIGDAEATGFPRFYVDADVVLSVNTIHEVARSLEDGRWLAASPRMEVDLTQSSWPVKAYYRVWRGLPYCKEGMIGTGVYVLSKNGRQRFAKFPNIIADDRYVRALFTSKERVSVEACDSLVKAPSDIWSLIRVKVRGRAGGYEFLKEYPHLKANEEKDYLNAGQQILRQVSLWPSLVVYLYVNLVSRWLARRNMKAMEAIVWSRDESSRSVKP